MSAKSTPEEKNIGLVELKKMGVAVKHVETPTSVSQLQMILKRATRERLTVMPVGGGTALAVGILPERVDVALDMKGMTGLMEWDTKNLNMTARAGMSIDAINEHLEGEGRGFFLPLDPPLSHRATIGGVYASNIHGPLRHLYGTLRDQALGMSAVDAGGRAVKFGGVTVKNVSGYDLTKFFIGSAGRLCVITRISCRIYPLPEASSLCEVILDSVEKVQDLLSKLRSSVLIPSGVVLAMDDQGDGFKVIARFEGHPEAVARQNKDFIKMGEIYGGRGEVTTGREATAARMRSTIDPDDAEAVDLTFKVSVPIVEGPFTYSAIDQLARDKGLATKMILLAGNGVLYVHASGGDHEALRTWGSAVKERATRLGGHVVLVKCSHEIADALGSTVDPVVTRHVLQPIKQKLDPRGVLLPLT